MTLREQRNRVIEALREWGLALDRAEANGSDFRGMTRITDQVATDAHIKALADTFTEAITKGTVNAVEYGTLEYIVRNWSKATLPERMIVSVAYLELRDVDLPKDSPFHRLPVLNRAW